MKIWDKIKSKFIVLRVKVLFFLGKYFNIKWAQVEAVKTLNPYILFPNPLAQSKHRNAPCPCGGGKKIKNCHGQKSEVNGEERQEIMDMIINSMNKIAQEVNSHKKG